MNTLLIESNRVIAQSTLNPTSAESETKTSQSHSQVQDKASWTTSIETGIQLSPGDQISMEAAMMNIDGSTQGFQQFNGRVPIPDQGTHIYRKDNEMKVTLAFYTTNLIQNNTPLPMGRHMCETTDCMQGNNGAPSFTGRSLWRPQYRTMRGDLLATQYLPLPPGWSGSFYCSRAAPDGNTGPTSIKRAGNGFFFVGMNYDQPLLNVVTSPSPIFAKSCAWAAGLASWTSLVPFYGLPGVQFGSNGSTKLPQKDAVGWENLPAEDPITSENLNRNVNIKDTYHNSGYFTGRKKANGGAAPWVILNGRIVVHPQIATTGVIPPHGSHVSSGNLPGDWQDFHSGPGWYHYEAQRESTFYRGSQYNYRPNGNKHFQPKIDVNGELCKGPYYSYDFNNLIIPGDSNYPPDPAMDDMCNLNIHSRTPDYWKLQTSEFNIQLKTGNITPTRIAQIITELMKKQGGTAADPETVFVKQQTFQPRSDETKDNTKDDLIILDQPNLSTQCYGLFPTMIGACLKAQKVHAAGSIYGWDCLTDENIKIQTLNDETSDFIAGRDYDPKQAELKYWSLMLAGDYLSWKWATYLNPLVSYRPFTAQDEILPDYDYKLWSVYTGLTNVHNFEGFDIFHKRKKANGGDSTVNIGNLGEFSCLQDQPQSGYSAEHTVACAGVWNQINGTSATTAQPWRINCEPYALWADTQAPFTPIKYFTFGADRYQILPTNIVFDGQVKLEDWNAAFDELEGHNIVAGGNDTLSSQSNEFFDNTFVEWTIGRLDDAETYNELWIADDFGFRQKNQSQEGYAQYLPNIYQSNQMFGDAIYNSGQDHSATGNINDILSRASCTNAAAVAQVVQGSYSLYTKKVGTYKIGGNYTATDNPWAYPNATGSIYDATKMGYPCWGVFKSEYELDVEKKNGYQKSAHRKIKGYRYLPQANLYNGYEYTASNAFNKNLLNAHEHSQKWSTKPATMSFAEYEKIFNKMKALNNGRGLGIIPIFSSNNALNNNHNNTPFVGIIYMDHEDKGMPLPVKGEWIGLSSPSLCQHDLSLPASTQRSPRPPEGGTVEDNQTEYASSWVGQRPFTGTNAPDAAERVRLIEAGKPSNWATTYYTGANDPVWSFDNTVNRFAYSQFHTPLYTGNGKWAFGDTGETPAPQTKEVRVVANTANFSRVKKLSYGCYGYLFGASAVEGRPAAAEIMEGNIIFDWTGPGGWYGTADNIQYLSPHSCTQWEMRYIPVPGDQIYTGPTPPETQGKVAPPNTHANDSKDLTAPSIVPFAYITTSPDDRYPTVSSQGGVGICALSVLTE